MLQRLVGDAANIDVKGGAILDQLGNVAGRSLRSISLSPKVRGILGLISAI
jgi:hypothetical protein